MSIPNLQYNCPGHAKLFYASGPFKLSINSRLISLSQQGATLQIDAHTNKPISFLDLKEFLNQSSFCQVQLYPEHSEAPLNLIDSQINQVRNVNDQQLNLQLSFKKTSIEFKELLDELQAK